MAGSLGTISGQVRLDVAQALASFAAVRTAAAAQTGALSVAGTKMSAFGKAMLVAGGALSAAFAIAINKAAEFEKKMDFFGAVTNSTGEQMAKVSALALELGRTSQFSAAQIADAFVEMGKAGISAEQITGGMAKAMVNLASAADIDLTTATNIVTSQIQAYSLAASDAAHVTDVLAGAANASIVDVQDLGVSLKYVGGVAHALGISFDSTVDALSLLGKAGIKGSTAGTSLRQIMVSLAGGTKKAKEELENLGIITADGANKFFDSTGKAKSLAEVFQILQDHTKGLTQEQQLMAFRTIFNNRALAAAEILTKAGAAGFAEMNSEISKTTAADVAAKRMDNLSGDIQKLKGNIDTLLIQAGTPFQEFLRSVVQNVTRVIQAFGALSPETQTLILRMIGITGAVLTFIGITATLAGMILKIAAAARIMAATWTMLTAVTRILTVATIQQTAAALMNPYVLLAMAVVALIAGLIILYQKSDKFREIMDAIGRGIKIGFMATVEWFKGLPKFFGDLWTRIVGWFKQGVGWAKEAWDSIVQFFVTAPGKIWAAITSLGAAIWQFMSSIPGAVTGFLSDAWNGFVNFLGQIPYLAGYVIGLLIGSFVRFAIEVGKLFWNMGSAVIDAIIWTFTKMPIIIATWLSETWTNISKFTVDSWNSFFEWCTKVINTVIEFFSQLPTRVAEFFSQLWTDSIQFFSNFIIGVNQWCIDTFNAVVEWFGKLPGRVIDFFTDMNLRMIQKGQQIKDWAMNLGRDVFNGIVDWFAKLPARCYDIISDVISVFNDMVAKALNAAKDFARGLWDGFKDGLGIHSPSYIERAMWAITDVTDAETKRLGSQVRTMQALAGEMVEKNPARAATEMNTARMISLTQGLKSQHEALMEAANSLFPMGGQYSLASSYAGASRDGGKSLDGSESSREQRAIIVNNFNPIAERGSDSASKKLRTLSDMGAF